MSVLGKIKRTFVHWNAALFLRLYPTYVRPHLECCLSVWNPYRKKDIRFIKHVQRRATKLIPELRHLKYEYRLASLEMRRDRDDIIQFFKIVKDPTLDRQNVMLKFGLD